MSWTIFHHVVVLYIYCKSLLKCKFILQKNFHVFSFFITLLVNLYLHPLQEIYMTSLILLKAPLSCISNLQRNEFTWTLILCQVPSYPSILHKNLHDFSFFVKLFYHASFTQEMHMISHSMRMQFTWFLPSLWSSPYNASFERKFTWILILW